MIQSNFKKYTLEADVDDYVKVVLSALGLKKGVDYATVTEDEKHRILIKTREELLRHAKNLNKLMNNHNVGVEQRVVYVSGMLLSMQDILDDEKNTCER